MIPVVFWRSASNMCLEWEVISMKMYNADENLNVVCIEGY